MGLETVDYVAVETGFRRLSGSKEYWRPQKLGFTFQGRERCFYCCKGKSFDDSRSVMLFALLAGLDDFVSIFLLFHTES
jgi:hypothetical protein